MQCCRGKNEVPGLLLCNGGSRAVEAVYNNEVCSAGESTNRCLLKPIELPEVFWFEPIFQGLGEYKARSLKRSFVVHCLGEFT